LNKVQRVLPGYFNFVDLLKKVCRGSLMEPYELHSLYNEILTQGNEIFSTTMGIVSHIENDKYEIIAVQSIGNVFVAGESFPLKETYCRDVYNTGKTIAITELEGKPGLQCHPLYKNLPIEVYISTPIFKHVEIWGTLNFSSMIVRPLPFSDNEIEYIKSSAQRISSALSDIS
jgi:GAF domain-containing protein